MTDFSKIKQFLKKYENKLILFLGLFLVSGLAFQAGYLKGQKTPQNPLVVEIPNCTNFQNKTSQTSNLTPQHNFSEKKTIPKKDCLFVGSKNSNKYHLPTCRNAKRIKPENLVCFSSVEDALSQGYQPSKDCIK